MPRSSPSVNLWRHPHWKCLTTLVREKESALQPMHPTWFATHHAPMPPDAEWTRMLNGPSNYSTVSSAMPANWLLWAALCHLQSTPCKLEGSNSKQHARPGGAALMPAPPAGEGPAPHLTRCPRCITPRQRRRASEASRKEAKACHLYKMSLCARA